MQYVLINGVPKVMHDALVKEKSHRQVESNKFWLRPTERQ